MNKTKRNLSAPDLYFAQTKCVVFINRAVSYKREKARWAKNNFWPVIFIATYITAGALTFTHWYNILPIIAQSFGALAVWQKKPRAIRYIMLVPRPLWFVYNALVGSYAGMVTEVVILISVLIGIVRFDILGQKEK